MKTYEARTLFCMAIDDRWEKIMDILDAYIDRGDKDIIKMLIEHRVGRPAPAPNMNIAQALPSLSAFFSNKHVVFKGRG